MNREERRRAARAQRATELPRQIADAYKCPDCNVDRRLVQDSPGVFVLRVLHDDTCPAYRAMTKGVL